MMIRSLIGAGLLAICALSAVAQAPLPAPSEAAKALVGVWELSNPDRDRRCQLTFKLDAAVGSSRVDLQACKLEYSIVSPK